MNQFHPIHVLVVTKGHDFDHNALHEMFNALEHIDATFVDHPAAQAALQPENIQPYNAIFFYDMCGIKEAGMAHDLADNDGLPSADYAASIEALLETGMGLVLVNHATVSWPHWPLWREISGSSFMLKAGELNGRLVPGSGYRGGHGPLPPATIALKPAHAEHPVLRGLEEGFNLTDELYLKTNEYGKKVAPILRGDYDFVQENFSPPPLAPQLERESWTHPPGSDLIVWANAARQSPVVVSDVGDGPLAFENPAYRTLMHNALHWVASETARMWARQENSL